MMIVRRRVFLFTDVLRLILLILLVVIIVVLPQLNIREYAMGTISGKLVFFLGAGLVLAVLYTSGILLSKQTLFKFSNLDITLLVLVLYISLNRYCIHTDYGFSIRYIELLALCLFYIALRSIPLKYFPFLLLGVIVSAVFQAFYGSFQLLGFYPSNHSGFKMTGSFFNPGPYAGFLSINWAVCLGMYLFREDILLCLKAQFRDKPVFYHNILNAGFHYIPVLGLVSIAVVLPALHSRASYLAVFFCSVVLLAYKNNFFKKITEKYTSRFLRVAALFVLSAFFVFSAIALYGHKKASSDGRLFIWKISREMISDAPVFGVGFDQFRAHYMNYQAAYFAGTGETVQMNVADNTFYCFNEWLQFTAENGVIGILILSLVLFTILKTRAEGISGIFVLILKTILFTAGVFACFSYPMQILPIKIILAFALAMLSNSTTENFEFKIIGNSQKRLLLKAGIFTLSCLGIYQTVVYGARLHSGFIAWNNALNIYTFGNYSYAVREFETAHSVFAENGDFLVNYGKALSMAGRTEQAVKVLEHCKKYQNNTITETALGDSYKKLHQYAKAEKAYLNAVHMAPGKFYGFYLLAKLYDDCGDAGKAAATAKMLLNKEIKVPSSAIREMQNEMKNLVRKYGADSGSGG